MISDEQIIKEANNILGKGEEHCMACGLDALLFARAMIDLGMEEAAAICKDRGNLYNGYDCAAAIRERIWK